MTTYADTYRSWVQKYLARPVRPDERVPKSRVLETEKRLQVRLPQALRDYYLTVGAVAELNRIHNHLLSPEEIEVDEGYLVFMDENQNVVSWGIRMTDLDVPDPTVWQRNNTPPEEWYSEDKSFSELLHSMFDWYDEMGVWRSA